MGTVPVPHTWTAGDDATSTAMQTLTDASLYCLGSATSGGSKKANCRLRQTVAQSPATATWAAAAFDVEDVDYDNGHSTVTNTSRYTAQTARYVEVGGVVWWTGNATGGRFAALAVNGTGGASLTGGVAGSEVGCATVPNAGNFSLVIPAMQVFLNVGDILEMYIFQSSGGALATVVAGLTQPMLSIADSSA